MKHGAIVGREVVTNGKKHHIMARWNNPLTTFGRSEGDSGKTLCGLWVLLGMGNKWEIVRGGAWHIGKDCGFCIRVLASLPSVTDFVESPIARELLAPTEEDNA